MLQTARERNIPVRPQIGRDGSMSASIKAGDAMLTAHDRCPTHHEHGLASCVKFVMLHARMAK